MALDAFWPDRTIDNNQMIVRTLVDIDIMTDELQELADKFDPKQEPLIRERHRHRYEFNNDFRQQLEECGLRLSGINPERNLVEIAEISDHPWMLAVQFQPEFQSGPMKPQPLFFGLIKATMKRLEKIGDLSSEKAVVS